MKKYIILSAAVLLLAAGCGKTQPQTNISPAPQPQAVNQPTNPPSSAKPTAKPIGQQDEPINISYQQIVNGKPDIGKVTVSEGMNALALLKMTHKVETKDYGSMGQFVLSIDGIKPDSKHFWDFFVNGKSSNIGVSSYVLKAGDKIEWKLTAISASGE
jgi:Domain of unknown function (DUF4430)